jgi:hypothetical protein
MLCAVAACTGDPTADNIPALSTWSCTSPSPHNSKCSAACNSGYTAKAGTSWAATCSLGTWGQPAVDAGSTAKLECWPNREYSANAWWTMVHCHKFAAVCVIQLQPALPPTVLPHTCNGVAQSSCPTAQAKLVSSVCTANCSNGYHARPGVYLPPGSRVRVPLLVPTIQSCCVMLMMILLCKWCCVLGLACVMRTTAQGCCAHVVTAMSACSVLWPTQYHQSYPARLFSLELP